MKKVNQTIARIYLGLGLIAFIAFFVLHFVHPSWYKENVYDFIIVCVNAGVGLIILFVNLLSKNLLKNIFLALALIGTCFADYFLTYKGADYEVALIAFIVVQLLYYLLTINMMKYLGIRLFITIVLRLVLIGIMVGVMFLLNKYSLLNLLVCIYFPLLVMNFVDAAINIFRIKNIWFSIVMALGFLFFIGCDVQVGLMNIGVSSITIFSIWICYIPSQVLLTSLGFIINNR